MKANGTIESVQLTLDNHQLITFKANNDILDQLDDLQGKDLDIEVRVHRDKRSLNANAYFHVLVNEISKVLGTSDTEIKINLNLEYGSIKYTDGQITLIRALSNVDVSSFYPYLKWCRNVDVGDVEFSDYIAYKRTSELDTKEMSRLIDGTVSEAKVQGIQVLSDSELDLLKKEWKS